MPNYGLAITNSPYAYFHVHDRKGDRTENVTSNPSSPLQSSWWEMTGTAMALPATLSPGKLL